MRKDMISKISRRDAIRSGLTVGLAGFAGCLSTGGGDATGRYILSVAPGASSGGVEELAHSVVGEFNLGGSTMVVGEFTSSAVDDVAARSEVRYIEPDVLLGLSPDDPVFMDHKPGHGIPGGQEPGQHGPKKPGAGTPPGDGGGGGDDGGSGGGGDDGSSGGDDGSSGGDDGSSGGDDGSSGGDDGSSGGGGSPGNPTPRQRQRKQQAREQQVLPWGIERINANTVHRSNQTNQSRGREVSVAVLDTGIRAGHPDLSNAMRTSFSPRSCRAEGCRNPNRDLHGHGTNVAGIVGARDNNRGVLGVAPRSHLHSIKVGRALDSLRLSAVIGGLGRVARQEYPVATLGLFGTTEESQALQDAISTAYDAGTLLVSGAVGPIGGTIDDGIVTPASYDEVIAVNPTTRDDTIASFATEGPEVELAAPGDMILTTSTLNQNYYAYRSGSGLAAAHVAGTAALIKSRRRSLPNARRKGNFENPGGIRAILRETAEELEETDSAQQGHGLINAEAAVLAAGNRSGE